jgi:hypothetical protein
MIKHEKHGHTIVVLLFLIILIPKISQMLFGSPIRIFGISLNDTVLLTIAIIALIITIFHLFDKTDSISGSKFKQLYKPKSDLNRLRQYIKEQRLTKKSDAKIRHTLIKVGWSDDLLDKAFKTASTAKLITLKPGKLIKRKLKKK